jgi:predicted anti-sigma-YlaC factor YlaD
MNQENCESICLAAMAVVDGETPPIPAAEIELHLGQCARCRSQVGQLKPIIDLLNVQRRREPNESVWDGVAENLKPRNEARTASDHWPWFLLLGLLLAGYRIAVVTSDWEPGVWLKLTPILFAVAVFALLRQNPFKVNPDIQFKTSLGGHL